MESSEKAQAQPSLQDKIQETADTRANFTRSFFEKHQMPIAAFVEKLKGEPFKISINPKDNKSLTFGIFQLQKKLGFAENDSAKGCDGKFGPYTRKQFESYGVRESTRAALADQRSQVGEVKAGVAVDVDSNTPQEGQDKREVVESSKTVFVGDSLTVLMRPYTGNAKHVSKGAQQTSWMNRNFSNFLEEDKKNVEKMKRVVILGGFNDITSVKSTESIKRNLGEMYENARKAGMSVAACTIPQWDIEGFLKYVKPIWKRKGWGKNGEYPLSAEELQRRTDEINQWIMAQKDVEHIDLYNGMADHDKFPRGDFVHLYGKDAKAMAQYIKQEGAIA